QAGTDLTIRWQESMQNFAIASVSPNAVVSQLATGPVMWIGAHPDDEGVVAPLLGDLCVERGQACTLLVATRGETGPCKLTGGCHPDLASVRTQEIQNAAVLFGAQLVLWNLPDQPGGTPESVLTAWANTVGGEDTLVDQMAAAIAVAAPAVIVTYDPRHGSTCHPAHRAVAALALSAVERLNRRETSAYFNHPGTVVPTVYLVETQIGFSADGSPNSFSLAVPDDARVRTYDATQRLARVNASAWEYLLSDTGVYRSQFSVTDLNTLRAIPLESQRVFLLPLADTSSVLDSRYTELCR
ncbi:MAG: PIG-L family deacetylase, partial [Candidatus Binatia bacterium]